ncbi:cAMP-responsive element-binding protein-like 2 [Actinia tenebrosa]|uniref:cAMP-responsive element-binding protein-like 2 n=1 Tax=Actinia tenebrosa TaxID=6105 RepID=A0A6P8IJZ7_ACTTE|nr:cAMP-responsive element-binding protein-like 2 [Actinia tenebrosa]
MASSFSELKPEKISSYAEEILRDFSSEQQEDNNPPFWIKRGRRVKHDSFSSVESNSSTDSPLSESPKGEMHSTKKTDGKKRGRRPSHLDTEAKLERSRQSARECRARKKVRYQHLDDMVTTKEEGVVKLWQELDMYRRWCKAVDQGVFPKDMVKFLKAERKK